MIETKPEQYLREIRDLQKQNLEILQRLSEYEDHKSSQHKWGIAFRVIGSLMPYLLSVALVWGFYMKIEDLTNSVQETVKNIPTTLSVNMGDKWDSLKEKGSEIWGGTKESSEKTSENLKEKWKNFRNN